MRGGSIFAAVMAAAALAAGGTLAADTERAARLAEQAEMAVRAAETPKQRLAALGQAAQAQEAGLAALRADIRVLARRGAELDSLMQARERTFRAVLSALERLQRSPPLAVLAHPGGAVSAARAGMALSAFVPALEREAARLSNLLDETAALRARREEAGEAVRESLASLQSLRTEIAALLDRERRAHRLPGDLRARLVAEADALARSAATLRALIGVLPPPPAEVIAAPAPSVAAQKGNLDQPAEGVVARAFGDRRPGVELSVRAYATVYAPWSGVIRFSGAYGDYGTLVILEPADDLLFVFAGLGETSRLVGDTVLKGEPIGGMGGPAPAADEFLISSADGEEALGRETLYIEVRESGAPVDPAAWFALVTEEGDG